MKANHVRKPVRNPVRALLVCAALGLLPVGAAAERVSRSDFDAFMDLATGNGSHTVGTGTRGTPMITKPVNSTAAGVGNMNFQPGAGAPVAEGKARLPLPGGRGAELLVRQPISKAAAGAAIAKFAFKAAWPLTLGLGLYELAQELGWRRITDGITGEVGWEKERKTQYCVNGTCYEFRYVTPGSWSAAPYFRMPAESCAAGQAWYNAQGSFPYTMSSVTAQQYGTPAQWSCTAVLTWKSNGTYYTTRTDNMSSRTIPPQTQVDYDPLTEGGMAADIAAASGWPDSRNAALSQALKEGSEIDLTSQAAVSVPADQSVIDGGKLTTRNILPSGNTLEKVEAKQYKITANPDGTITVKEETTTTERELSPGGTLVPGSEKITGTTEKEVDKSDMEKQKESCTETSTGLDCAQLDTPEGEIPKETKTITYTAETPFGDGSCPANVNAMIGTLGQSVTVWNWQKTCSQALPLRALVISLATFAAFLILMPTKVET